MKKETDEMLNMIQNLSTLEQNPDSSESNSKDNDEIKNIFDFDSFCEFHF